MKFKREIFFDWSKFKLRFFIRSNSKRQTINLSLIFVHTYLSSVVLSSSYRPSYPSTQTLTLVYFLLASFMPFSCVQSVFLSQLLLSLLHYQISDLTSCCFQARSVGLQSYLQPMLWPGLRQLVLSEPHLGLPGLISRRTPILRF